MSLFKLRRKKPRQAPPCPSGVYWTIEPGDTFYIISKRLGIPIKKIMEANPDVDPNNLQIGSKICIPKMDS